MWKQIKFTWIEHKGDGDPIEEIDYGFGKFDEDENLVEVVCGCCGGTFDVDEVAIIKIYDFWAPLEEFIMRDDD